MRKAITITGLGRNALRPIISGSGIEPWRSVAGFTDVETTVKNTIMVERPGALPISVLTHMATDARYETASARLLEIVASAMVSKIVEAMNGSHDAALWCDACITDASSLMARLEDRTRAWTTIHDFIEYKLYQWKTIARDTERLASALRLASWYSSAVDMYGCVVVNVRRDGDHSPISVLCEAPKYGPVDGRHAEIILRDTLVPILWARMIAEPFGVTVPRSVSDAMRMILSRGLGSPSDHEIARWFLRGSSWTTLPEDALLLKAASDARRLAERETLAIAKHAVCSRDEDDDEDVTQ